METLKQILDNLRCHCVAVSQWPEPTPPLNCVAMPVDEADRNEVQRSQARCLAALSTGQPTRSIMQNEELKELAQGAAIQVQGRSLIPLDAQIRAGTDFCCNSSLGEEKKRSPKGCFLRCHCVAVSLDDVSDDFPMAVVKGRGDLL